MLLGSVPKSPGTITTPPVNAVSPPGTLFRIEFPSRRTSLPPTIAMPIPDSGGVPSSVSGHAFVLWSKPACVRVDVAGRAWRVGEHEHAEAVVVAVGADDPNALGVAHEHAEPVVERLDAL